MPKEDMSKAEQPKPTEQSGMPPQPQGNVWSPRNQKQRPAPPVVHDEHSPMVAQNAIDNRSIVEKFRSNLMMSSIGLLVIAAALTGTALASTSVDYIELVNVVAPLCVFIVGVIAASVMARRSLHYAQDRQQGVPTKPIGTLQVLGVISMILGFVFPPLFLIGIVLIVLAIQRRKSATATLMPDIHPVAKWLLVILSFAAGLIPGIIAAFIVYLIIWSHWCDVTNSKCL